jgi:multidrug efflux system outer membrane protein
LKRLSCLLPLLLTACALGPDYRRPKVDPPSSFRGAPPSDAASLADQAWFEVFADPALKALVEEGLRANFDLRVATWRMDEYRARAGVAKSGWYPAITPFAAWQRGRSSAYTSGGGGIGNGYDVQASASWEVDLWGRVRRLNEEALAGFLGARDARAGVYLATVAQVAGAYFELRELDHRLHIARETVAAFQETHALFSRRLEGGAASALETARARAALASAAATVPNLERQIHAQENLLCFLLGRGPGPIERGSDLAGQTLPPAIPSGLPSTLLERRPDIREAEARLVAANAEVGVATANYFPTLSLTGMLGVVAPQVSQYATGGKTWNVGPVLGFPVFQGPKLKYQKEAALAQCEQARLRYQATVSAAFGEVSNALVAYRSYAEMEAELAKSVAALQEAVGLVQMRYTAGLSNYLEVLDAQQQLFPAQNALSQARLARLQTLVQLYKSLGGGWKVNPLS